MVLLYVSNDAPQDVANARALAKRRWPTVEQQVRNPARVDKRQGVEVDGVAGVVIVGDHPRLTQLYKRTNITVLPVITLGKQPVDEPSPNAISIMARIAERICSLEEAKVCAVIGASDSVRFLTALGQAEGQRDKPREGVFTALTQRLQEFVGNA